MSARPDFTRPRARPLPWVLRSVATCALAALASCVGGPDSCFLPPSIVDGTRLLAVRADPPDQVVDLDKDDDPKVHVRVLFAGHSKTTRLRLGGKICVPTDDLRCPAHAEDIVDGDEHEASEFEADADLLVPMTLIREAKAADPLKGYGGIRVLFDAKAQAGATVLHAGKILLFQEKSTGIRPNGAIELDAVELLQPELAARRTDPDHSTLVSVSQTYGVRPLLRAGAGASEPMEQYDITDLTGRPVTLREVVSYSFFTTPDLIFGDLKVVAGNPVAVYVTGSDVADEPAPGTPAPSRGLVRMTSVAEASTWIWVVARDGRGAVAWARGSLTSIDERIGRRADLRPVCDPLTR